MSRRTGHNGRVDAISERQANACRANLIKAVAANALKPSTAVDKTCPTCQTIFKVKRSHASIEVYCSKVCMSTAYQERLRGESNPNYRNAGARTCEKCGAGYSSYNKTRQFCSRACSAAAHTISKPPPVPRPVVPFDLTTASGRSRARKAGQDVPLRRLPSVDGAPIPNKTCIQCGAGFHAYAKSRMFCSYPCHIASGGARRAGMAAKKATMRYGAKKDANHVEIVAAMRLCGLSVLDVSTLGCGVPDLIVFIPQLAEIRLVEIKNLKTGYGRRGLNKNQRDWLKWWKGSDVIIVTSVQEVADLAAGRVHLLKTVEAGSCA